MAVAIPFFIIKLTDKDYTAMLNKTGADGTAVANARLDPEIEFRDGTTTVVVGLDYRAMVNKHTPFRRFIKMSSFTEAMAFATDTLKTLIQTRIDDARDGCRDTFNPPGFVEPAQPVVDPNASGKSAANAILKDSPGMAIGRSHGDPKSADFLTELMNQDPPPVDMLFIEEFRIEAQQELTDYLQAGNEAPMGPALKQRVAELKSNFNVDWEPILFKAKQKGVKIFGIDTTQAEPGVESNDPRYGERRVAVMNTMAMDVVKKAQTANPGGKFVLMCGDAHLNTHPGGVPGLAQMAGVPGMHVNPKGQLRVAPDDKTKRGMPDALPQAFIDAAMEAAVSEYAKIPEGTRNPKNLEPDHARRVMEKLAKEYVAGRDLAGPGDIARLLTEKKTTDAIKAMCDSTKGRDARKPLLEAAVKAGNAGDVTRLLTEDPDLVHQGFGSDVTLLHMAAESGQDAIIKMLLRAGANPNALDEAGTTPMHIAGKTGSVDVMQELRDAGGDLSIPDGNGKTAYANIVERKDPALLEELVKDEAASVQDLFVRVFEEQARERYEDSPRDPSLHEEFNPGELRKVALARFNVLKDLSRLEEASDVHELLNVDDDSFDAITQLIAVTKARKARRREMVTAVTGGNKDGAAAIMKADPLFSSLEISENKTALSLAAVNGQNLVMMGLLAEGADPNHVNSIGRTTLHELASVEIGKTNIPGQEKISETAGILMDLGADPNVQNGRGQTPLHLAGFRNNVSFVEVLAEKRADATIQDNRGWTAYDMTLGSTNKEAEKAFHDGGLATKTAPTEAGTHSSVDLLCMATLSNDPTHDELKTRKMYEKLYAEESLRPLLDLAAAATCNDRAPPKGGLRLFTNDKQTVGPLYGATIGPSGAYDEKVNSLLIGTQTGVGEKEPGGTLAHELTHMAAHLVTDNEDTIPAVGDKQKGEYLTAISEDLKRLHLLSDNDESQKFVKNRIGGRMVDYNQKKPGEETFEEADKRLLQEFIVGVPQLIASFGIDYVREQAPNLTKYFEDFSKQIKNTLDTDPRFAKGRAAIDPEKNKALVARLTTEGVGPKAPEPARITKDKPDFDPDAIVAKVRAEYIANNGRRKAIPEGGRTVPSGSDDFEIDPVEQAAVDKKLVLLKKILTTTMAPDRLPRTISSDSLKDLIQTLGSAVHDAPNDKDLLKIATLTSDTWAKQAKIDYVDFRVAGGHPVDTDVLADAIVLKAELKARTTVNGNDDSLVATAFDTKQSKHTKAVEELTLELTKDENRERLKKPGDLLRILPLAISDPGKNAIRIKPPKRGSRQDVRHVSIDPKAAKREWLTALQTMPLH